MQYESFNSQEFRGLANPNDDTHETNGMAMSELQMILAESGKMDKVNSW